MQTLLHFKNFIDELGASNSRNYKIEILKKYSKDEDIKKYLYFLINPYIVTGISDKKLGKEVKCSSDIVLESVYDLFDYLITNNTGKDIDIFMCQEMLSKCPTTELKDILFKIITKSLTLGIDAKTINTAIPECIPQFSLMLANKYFDKPDYVKGKEFALTRKIDGGRIIALKENGIVSFYTRAGQRYEGLVDLEKELLEFFPDNICLDGEITLLNPAGLSSKDQYKQTMKITRKDGEKHGIKMLVFDIMHAEEFKSQYCPYTYKERRKYADQVFSNKSLQFFELLPVLYCGTDIDQIDIWLNKMIAAGEEGIMINITDALYEFRRTSVLLKCKKMSDLDLPLIGFEEGTGKNAGKLGAIIVDYKGNKVKVGSGFTDELREEIWKNQDIWLGRTIVVQYFEITTNQNGGISLRFPIYIDYRTDK